MSLSVIARWGRQTSMVTFARFQKFGPGLLEIRKGESKVRLRLDCSIANPSNRVVKGQAEIVGHASCGVSVCAASKARLGQRLRI